MNKEIVLTERQYEYVNSLKTQFSKLWMGSVNKLVANSLIKKGICKIDKDYNLVLTKFGKSI